MALFKKTEQPVFPPEPELEPVPTVTVADLGVASRLLDQWDASQGNSNAMWDSLEAIARRGGFKGADAYIRDDRGSAAAQQRPWQWWNEAGRVAERSDDLILAGRIFFFTVFFVRSIEPQMNIGDGINVGLWKPGDELFRSIAATAVTSLARVAPNTIISDSAAGQATAEAVLLTAERVSGIVAARQQTLAAADTASALPSATPSIADISMVEAALDELGRVIVQPDTWFSDPMYVALAAIARVGADAGGGEPWPGLTAIAERAAHERQNLVAAKIGAFTEFFIMRIEPVLRGSQEKAARAGLRSVPDTVRPRLYAAVLEATTRLPQETLLLMDPGRMDDDPRRSMTVRLVEVKTAEALLAANDRGERIAPAALSLARTIVAGGR